MALYHLSLQRKQFIGSQYLLKGSLGVTVGWFADEVEMVFHFVRQYKPTDDIEIDCSHDSVVGDPKIRRLENLMRPLFKGVKILS